MLIVLIHTAISPTSELATLLQTQVSLISSKSLLETPVDACGRLLELANTTGLTQATSTISKSTTSTPKTTSSGKKVGRPKGSTAAAKAAGGTGGTKRKIQEDFVPRKSTRTRAAAAVTQEEKAAIIEVSRIGYTLLDQG
jgi:hypothetical protein